MCARTTSIRLPPTQTSAKNRASVWLPAIGEQLVDARGGVSLHTHEDIFEVGECVDAVTLGGQHERVEDGEVAGGQLVSEEPFFLARATTRRADSLALL
jgi:hypothetical protein